MGLGLIDAIGSTRGQRYAIDHPTDGGRHRATDGYMPGGQAFGLSTMGLGLVDAIGITRGQRYAIDHPTGTCQKKSPRKAGINVQHTS